MAESLSSKIKSMFVFLLAIWAVIAIWNIVVFFLLQFFGFKFIPFRLGSALVFFFLVMISTLPLLAALGPYQRDGSWTKHVAENGFDNPAGFLWGLLVWPVVLLLLRFLPWEGFKHSL